MLQLRQYQEAALVSVRERLSADKTPIIYSPTGSGKTEMAMHLLAERRERGERCLFIVNRKEIVKQTSERFSAAQMEHGVLQADNTRMCWHPMLVCSIQTIARRGIPEDIGLIVIDEAHGVPGSQQYVTLLRQAKCDVIGLTATPFSKGLGKHFDEIVVAATIRQLIEQGFLVDIDVYAAPEKPDLAKVRTVAGDYHEGELAEEMNRTTLVGNIVEHYLKLTEGKPAIVFCVDIKHSMNVTAQFMQHGVHAEHIDAYTPDARRKDIIERFKGGEIKVISNCAVLAEGFDAPLAEVMILARPTKSLIRFIQMAGRILRPFPGKNRALILDHSDTVARLGFPTDDLPLKLDMGIARQQVGAAGKPLDHLPKECPQCHYVRAWNIVRCPECGFVVVPQANVEYKNVALEQMRRKKHDIREIYAQMLGYTTMKGKKPGMAFYKTLEWFKGDEKLVRSTLFYERSIVPAPPSPEVMRWIQSRTIAWAYAKRKQEDAHL
jgi:DNA repair protein RadD